MRLLHSLAFHSQLVVQTVYKST